MTGGALGEEFCVGRVVQHVVLPAPPYFGVIVDLSDVGPTVGGEGGRQAVRPMVRAAEEVE